MDDTAEDRVNDALIKAEDNNLLDLEDIGNTMQSQQQESSAAAAAAGATELSNEGKPSMVTPLQRKKLTREGYKIIGSHSAVNLCRYRHRRRQATAPDHSTALLLVRL